MISVSLEMEHKPLHLRPIFLGKFMNPWICLGMVFAVAFASPAQAYIDPVTGSFVLQAIIGGFAAALVAIRRVREKILGFFGIGKFEDKTNLKAGNGDDT